MIRLSQILLRRSRGISLKEDGLAQVLCRHRLPLLLLVGTDDRRYTRLAAAASLLAGIVYCTVGRVTRGQIHLTDRFESILAERGWSNADLSRAMGHVESSVSRVRRREQSPGTRFIARLMLALNDGDHVVRFEEVFDIDGLPQARGRPS